MITCSCKLTFVFWLREPFLPRVGVVGLSWSLENFTGFSSSLAVYFFLCLALFLASVFVLLSSSFWSLLPYFLFLFLTFSAGFIYRRGRPLSLLAASCDRGGEVGLCHFCFLHVVREGVLAAKLAFMGGAGLRPRLGLPDSLHKSWIFIF